MVGEELLSPAVADAIGDFLDSEENKWWIRPLKYVIMALPFVLLAYFFFTT